MKKLLNCIKKLVIACFFSSCSGFLDIVPDNTVTLDDLFVQRETAYNALAKVYSYLPWDWQYDRSSWFLGDEWLGRQDVTLDTYIRGNRIMRGFQTTGEPHLGLWSGTGTAPAMYKAMRDANLLLDHVNEVPDMDNTEKADWSAQVKFLKAYYTFLLLRQYGPIVLIDKSPTSSAPSEDYFVPRSKIDDCFDFIIKLMDEAIPDLKARALSLDLGQIDQVVATAIKARVLLYRASPFYNGNSEYFFDFLDHDGEPFFPQEYNKEKWKDALDAIEVAIKRAEDNGVEFYHFTKQIYAFDVEDYAANPQKLQQLYDLRFVVVEPWNKELIWGNSNVVVSEANSIASGSTPRLPAGYFSPGSTVNSTSFSQHQLCATSQMVERYYTENGLPLDEDPAFDQSTALDIVRTPASYTPEYAPLRGIMQPDVETINLYLKREPRFYANLAITGGYWRAHQTKIFTKMFRNTDGGRTTTSNTDFFCTGVGVKKIQHPESTSGNAVRLVRFPYPIIRLADLYLMKAEAQNEYEDSQTSRQKAYEALNKVRDRAGVPHVEDAWRTAKVHPNYHLTQDGLKEIILRERSIELAFEGHRFWDMIRQNRAPAEFSVPLWGWNANGTTAQTFFVLQIIQARSFTAKDCLWPITVAELNTNSKLIQNPGW
jgi:hypothetical protein